MKKNFYLVDVFTSKPFSGNQLAVFPDGSGLTDGQMQQLAREFNFSETTFVMPPELPGCDYRVRIFTPNSELPMAGHPTLGTAHVLKNLGNITVDRAIFQEEVGAIPINFGPGDWISMDQPKPIFGPVFEVPSKIAPIAGLEGPELGDRAEAQIVSCGVPFLIFPVRDRLTLDRVKINPTLEESARGSLKFAGIYFWCPGDRVGEYHTRMFAPGLGISEDPATGSAAGPLVCYLVRQGVEELFGGTSEITIHQGEAIGRPSLIKAKTWWDQSYTRVMIQGQSCIVGSGEISV